MRISAITICLALTLAPSKAWHVERSKDRMTDKTVTWASARSDDATLLVGCLNGRVAPRLTWARRIGFGTIGVTWRADSGPVVPRMAMVSDDGKTLYPWLTDGAEVIRAKRVRVQIGSAFYDFDTTAGEPLPRFGKC